MPAIARVGSDIADARARAEFSGRPVWSAMVECVGRMELIQAKGGGSAKVQIDGYADKASSLAKLDRGIDQAAASALVAKERERLRPRVAAKWDADYARMRALPWGEWGLMCHGLQQHAVAVINAKNNAAYQKYLADFQRQRQLDNERSGREQFVVDLVVVGRLLQRALVVRRQRRRVAARARSHHAALQAGQSANPPGHQGDRPQVPVSPRLRRAGATVLPEERALARVSKDGTGHASSRLSFETPLRGSSG